MNAKALFLSLLIICGLVSGAIAQGFGGLGTQADGFDAPKRGTVFSFPKDHGAHPNFRIEWWYLTANLKGEDGKDYGVQWTLFRSALRPQSAEKVESGWDSPQVWMGHAGLTTPRNHYFAETRARGGIGIAGVQATPFHAWINDWSMKSDVKDGSDELSRLTLSASGTDFDFALDLDASGPLILHGDKGYSQKAASGQASHYYSQPSYKVSGVLNLPKGKVVVSGTAWLDREWSSQPLAQDQKGWDWVSLNFTDGSKLMGFGLRSSEKQHFTSATWIGPDGKTKAYGDGALKLSPLKTSQVEGRSVPTSWRIELPDQRLDIVISALNPQAWMGTSFPYWEGPVDIDGSHEGKGYLEMTGYEKTE